MAVEFVNGNETFVDAVQHRRLRTFRQLEAGPTTDYVDAKLTL